MKSISQTFGENLKKKNQDNCITLIDGYGLKETDALFWLSITSYDKEKIVDYIKHNEFELPESSKNISNLLLLMSNKIQWKYKKDLFNILINYIDKETFRENYLFHAASFFGCHEAFNDLEEKQTALFGVPFNWNSLNDSEDTPLSMALSQNRADTCIEILKRGGEEIFTLKNGSFLSVINKVSLNCKKGGMAKGYNKHEDLVISWKRIKTKFQLEESISNSYSKSQKAYRIM